MTIADDGVGFDVNAVGGKGLGLISMIERLEAIGGTFGHSLQSRRRDPTGSERARFRFARHENGRGLRCVTQSVPTCACHTTSRLSIGACAFDRRQQVFRDCLLLDEGGRSGRERGAHDRRVPRGCQQNDFDTWIRLCDLPAGLQATDSRHVQVEDNQVGLEPFYSFEQCAAVIDAPDHLAVPRQQPSNGSHKVREVVGKQHAWTSPDRHLIRH